MSWNFPQTINWVQSTKTEPSLLSLLIYDVVFISAWRCLAEVHNFAFYTKIFKILWTSTLKVSQHSNMLKKHIKPSLNLPFPKVRGQKCQKQLKLSWFWFQFSTTLSSPLRSIRQKPNNSRPSHCSGAPVGCLWNSFWGE